MCLRTSSFLVLDLVFMLDNVGDGVFEYWFISSPLPTPGISDIKRDCRRYLKLRVIRKYLVFACKTSKKPNRNIILILTTRDLQ